MCMKMVHPLVGLELNHHEAFGSHPELPVQGVCTALRKKTSIFCIKDLFKQQVLKQRKLRLSSKEGILQQTVKPQDTTGLVIGI